MAPKTRSSRASPKSSGFELLPLELIQQILSFLDPPDFKILRLTCSSLEHFAAQHLFKRVHLSFLNTHRDAFMGVSQKPRLASFVRELVWYEVDVSGFQDRRPASTTPYLLEQGPGLCLGDDAINEQQLINKDLYDLRECFWWPWQFCRGLFDRNTVRGVVRYILPVLKSPLDRLPHLRTFISRPCPDDQNLVLAAQQKEFTIDAIRGVHPAVGNIGLLVMLTYLATSERNLQNLFWADAHDTMPSFLYVEERHTRAFKSLTKLDLCISLDSNKGSLGTLASCLYAAENLEYLKLCCEKTEKQWPAINSLQFLLEYSESGLVDGTTGDLQQSNAKVDTTTEAVPSDSASSHPVWTRLSTLELVDVCFQRSKFVDFLHRHAQSLRHLRIEECAIYRSKAAQTSSEYVGAKLGEGYESLVRAMAAKKGFNFHSIRFDHASNHDDERILVDAESLVKFVNNTGESPFDEEDEDSFYFDTHITKFDDAAFPSAAYFYALANNRDNRSEASLDDEDAGAEGENEDEDADSEASTVDAYDTEGPRRNWGELQVLDEELDTSTYWVLYRVQNHIVWWSTNNPDEGLYKTEQWLFERSDGSWAYGCEPLDFWEDWDSDDEASDGELDEHSSEDHRAKKRRRTRAGLVKVTGKAKPSPFGPSFDKFCLENTYGDEDPLTLEYPPHARILMDDQTSMLFSKFVSDCWQARSGWEKANKHRTVLG